MNPPQVTAGILSQGRTEAHPWRSAAAARGFSEGISTYVLRPDARFREEQSRSDAAASALRDLRFDPYCRMDGDPAEDSIAAVNLDEILELVRRITAPA